MLATVGSTRSVLSKLSPSLRGWAPRTLERLEKWTEKDC